MRGPERIIREDDRISYRLNSDVVTRLEGAIRKFKTRRGGKTKRPKRIIWEEGSIHRSVAGKEYDELWDYIDYMEQELDFLRKEYGLLLEWGRLEGLDEHERWLVFDKLSETSKAAIEGKKLDNDSK